MIIHPLNVEGKYYVDQDTCTCSEACEYHAPDFFAIDREDYGAYVYRQPENDDEEQKIREGMNVCPVEAIHDDDDTKNI